MALLRRLLSRLLTMTAPYALVILLAAVLLNTVSVKASQVTVTLSGVTTTGSTTDTTGVFVSPGGSLLGYNFTLVYTIDDTKGVSYLGTYPACSNGLQNSGAVNNPVLNAVLTINGRSYLYNQLSPPDPQTAYVGSANGTTPKMTLVGDLSPAFSGNLHGSEIAQYQVNLDSTTTCRDWKSAFNYTLVPGTDTVPIGSLSVSWGPNTPFVNTVQFSARGLVQTVTVSGPTTSPTLATTSGQNFSCPSGCGVQTAALGSMPSPNVANGDPINAAVGNMTISETDFMGPGNTHLVFARHYNSLDTTDVGLGVGWHSTYHHGLTIVTSSSIRVTRPGGRQDMFSRTGTSWVPQANVTSVLASTTSPAGYKLTLTNDTVENYNTSGQLTSIVTRAGLTTALTYSTTGLTTVTGPFGHTLTFTFDPTGHVATMKVPDGTHTYTYAYDGNSNLVSLTNPDSTTRFYGHGAIFPNLITELIDEDGNPYSAWGYDSTGRAISSQHAAGVDLMSLTYTSTSSVKSTDALGNTTTYALTGNFGLVQPTAVNGVPNLRAGGAAFTYTTSGFVASSTDFNGNVTQYTYNAKGEELTRTEAFGTALARTSTTTWHATFHLPTRIDEPLSRTTTFGYDANGNLLTKSITDGTHVRKTSYTYDANGLRISATDALNHTTTWTYDASGNVKTMVNALGQTTTYNTYDANGRLISVTNPLGLVTTLGYDALGRMTSKKVGGLLTSYAWDSGVNKVSAITYPDSTTLNFGYDDAHRLIQVTDALSNAIKYTYDDNSNVTNVNVLDSTTSVKATHSYTYDSANRVLTSIGAAMGETTTYGYDNQGNLLRVIDPLSHTTSYTYDALNRLKTVVDALGNTTSYVYSALDDVTVVKDPLGLTTTYTYDGLHDVLTVVSPDTGTTVNSYNAAGLLLTTTDSRGKTASYTYDALNRTSTVTYTGGVTVGYLYDTTTNGIGSLTKMVDPAGSTDWTYDQFSRVVSKAQTKGALTLTTTYSYGATGRVSSVKYPSGRTATYAYDTAGRIESISFGALSVNTISYFPFGPAKGWNHPSGSAMTRAFDQDGRITGTTLNGTTSNVQTVTYDNAGRITALSETATVFASSHTFGYDSLNRLTSFFNGTTTNTWTYDANGNRKTSVLGGTTTYNYPGTSNRLTSLTGTTTASYGYDALGNTTSDGTHVWTYDNRGRMATLVAGTTTASYSVNGFGQRTVKSGNTVPSGGTNEYVYDEQGNLIGEYGSTGTVVNETVYLPNTPVSVLSRGLGLAGFGRGVPVAVLTGVSTVSSIAPDWLGAPHIIIDDSNNWLWAWDHYAFGNNAPNQNPKGMGTYTYNLRFPGQYADAESGLNYNWNRDYNLNIGRYSEADPIGLEGGLNLYLYTKDNPVWAFDPYGLYWKFIWWEIEKQDHYFGIFHSWKTQAVCYETDSQAWGWVLGPYFQDGPVRINMPEFPVFSSPGPISKEPNELGEGLGNTIADLPLTIHDAHEGEGFLGPDNLEHTEMGRKLGQKLCDSLRLPCDDEGNE